MSILIENNEELGDSLEALAEIVYLAQVDAADPAAIQQYMALAHHSLRNLSSLLAGCAIKPLGPGWPIKSSGGDLRPIRSPGHPVTVIRTR